MSILNKLKRWVVVGGLFVCSLVSAIATAFSPAYAEETTSTMWVSPMNYRLILIPGEVYDGSIKISNPATAKSNLEYSLTVGSFSQFNDGSTEDDYGGVDTETISGYNQIMNWIALEKTSGSVAPNETDQVNYKITVPEDAPAGGQYATIIVVDETGANIKAESGSIQIASIPRMASIIYAEVTGETREIGSIVKNELPTFLFSGNLEAKSFVRNDGNVHTDASYTFQVWPLNSNEEICTNEEKPATSLVLPESTRYHTESCSLPSIGIFRARSTIKIFNEESVVERNIIVCPLWLLFLILLALFLLIFKIFWGKKKDKK